MGVRGVLTPSEIAEMLTPLEYVRLCGKIEHKYHKAFAVVSVTRKDATHTKVVIELENGVHEEVIV